MEGQVYLCAVCGALHKADQVHQYEYRDLSSISLELRDPINFEMIVDGVQLPCQHMFSRCNVEEWVAEGNGCPTCREPATIGNLQPLSRVISNMLNELKVRVCSRKFSGVCLN